MRASKKVKGAVLLAAGAALVLGAPTVHADTESEGNDGILGGAQLLNGVQLNVPLTVAGVGAVLGSGEGEADVEAENKSGGAKKSSGNKGGGGGDVESEDNDGILGGLQVGNNLQANVPVTACGVGALLARGEGDCEVEAKNKRSGGGGDITSEDNDGILGGAQVLNNAQLNVPVTLCGIGLLVASAEAECEVESVNVATGGGNGDVTSEDNDGILGGLQLLNNLQANVPVTVCGLAVLGTAEAECEVEASNESNGGKKHHDKDDDDDGDKDDDDGDKDDDDGDRGGSVRGATLPKTGAAGMALIPFGLALVAGGVALRRRVGAES